MLGRRTHLVDAECQKTTEGSSSGSSGEEEGHSETAFVTSVPHGDIIRDTRKQSTFSDTEENAHGNKTTKVLDQT